MPKSQSKLQQDLQRALRFVTLNIAQFLPIVFIVLLSIFLVLSMLVVLNMTIAVFDPPSTSLDHFELFVDCSVVALVMLLTGNGFYAQVDDFAIDYIPLGVTLLCAVMLYYFGRKLPVLKLRAIFAGAVFYVFCLGLLFTFQAHTGDILLVLNLTLPFLLSFLTLLCANQEESIFKSFRVVFREHWVLRHIPRTVLLSLRASLSFVAILLLISTALFIFSFAGNLETAALIFEALNVGPWSAFLVSVVCVLFLPNMVVYTTSQLFSTGFQFGNLAAFQNGSPIDVKTLPPLPLLSANVAIDQTSVPDFVGGFTIILVSTLLMVWLTLKTRHELLFTAYTHVWIVASKVARQVLILFLMLLEVLVGLMFLAYVSSGRVGKSIGFIGLDPLSFSMSIVTTCAVCVPFVVVGYLIFCILQPKSEERDILKKEVEHDVEKKTHVEVVHREKNEKGKRIVKSRVEHE
jgi:hypothetical protein